MPEEAIQQQTAVFLLYLPVSNIPRLISESLRTYIIQHANSQEGYDELVRHQTLD
jgi:hypothetical protein